LEKYGVLNFLRNKVVRVFSMKQALNYGRISWSFDEDFDPKVPCRPSPVITFNPVRIGSQMKHPLFSDRTTLLLLKYKTPGKYFFKEAYRKWHEERSGTDRDLGEGRAFLRWLYKQDRSIDWKPHDFKLHPYFTSEDAPKHDPLDEMANGLSFAIRPVEVKKRKVKLYLQDDAVLNLISLPYGDDHDFLDLVKEYVAMRFQWEEWKAPAPPFLEWVKAKAKRPVFTQGQLGLSL
jgi:hypothetical protein